jgi:nitric oxide reductase NorQ protein
MFDEAREDLIDALADKQHALAYEDAKAAIDGGDLMAEQAIKQHAEVETVDGEKFVVSVGDRTYAVPDEDDFDDGEPDAEPVEDDGGADDSEVIRPQHNRDVDLSGDEKEFYEVNGVTIDVNPEQALAGEPTGDDVYGARVLTNSHPAVPDTQIPYFPADLGERDTEEIFYRAMSKSMPVILEGEAGTGKNQLVASAASRLNLPMYRQEFGADTSVMDVVGEKDLDGDGGTFYILGKAAKAAMFGGIYVADEINMATGSVTSYLHPLFEDEGSRELELRGTGRTLRDLPEGVEWNPEEHLGRYIHPDFRAVGTCNPLHYADTSEMNGALRSRCLVIEHPYLADSEKNTEGIETEAALLAEETGVEPDDVERLVRLAAVLREARREGNAISCPIGHRELRDTVELAGPNEGFMSFEAAAKIKIVGQASLKQDKQYIEDTVEDEL